MNSKELIKINIGSGPNGKSDWINLDWGILPLLGKMCWLAKILIKVKLLPKKYFINWPKSLRLVDCRKKLPFKSGSVDFIYTSHFIEHLTRYQTIKLLAECKRILRSGGVLRIAVPDIKLLSEKYVSGDKNFFIQFEKNSEEKNKLESLADLFVQNFYGYDFWSKPNFIQKLQRFFIRGHLWMYDYDSLSMILRDAGFLDIKKYEPIHGKTPDIEYLDIHKTSSLFIEASNIYKK